MVCFEMYEKRCKLKVLNMFIYTEAYTESHRIYNTKTHRRNRRYIFDFHMFQKPIFSQTRHSNKSAFYADSYETINILYNSTIFIVVDHTA